VLRADVLMMAAAAAAAVVTVSTKPCVLASKLKLVTTTAAASVSHNQPGCARDGLVAAVVLSPSVTVCRGSITG
jgi:hypothetical protein